MRPGQRNLVETPPRNPPGDDDDDDEDEDEDYDESWIQWFCSLEGHVLLADQAEDEEYIRDRFNLFGLKALVLNFERALGVILSEGPPQDEMPDSEFTELYRDSRDLYGLVHARYITSPRGLAVMKEKFVRGQLGRCPRVLCDRQNTLPVGLTDQLDEYNVRLYCPKCQETYEVGRAGNQADGAYFGTSFPHVFLQSFPNLVPLEPPVSYVPKIFGFRVSGKKSIIQVKLEAGEYGDSLRGCRAVQDEEGGERDAMAAKTEEVVVSRCVDDKQQSGGKLDTWCEERNAASSFR